MQDRACFQLLTSVMQVYNERIFDLLNEGVPPLEGWRHLELKEDAHGGVFVDGLKEVLNCFSPASLEFPRSWTLCFGRSACFWLESQEGSQACNCLHLSATTSSNGVRVSAGWHLMR